MSATLVDMSVARATAPSAEAPPFPVDRLRPDFPILSRQVRGKPLVYLDNAATSQKPQVVLDEMVRYYSETNANIHRGVHYLSEAATEAYDQARATVARFIGAPDPREVIFVRGATEAINLVAHGYAAARLREGDEVVVSALEHHANLIPWQEACRRTGAKLRIIPCFDNGELDIEAYRSLLNERTRLVAVTWISNALGTVVPVADIIRIAKERSIPVLIDACQAVPHLPVDVASLGADFIVWSGHKVFGPTGIGVLWGRAALLEPLPPYQTGGDMIDHVTYERATYRGLPERFEAGTPHMGGAIGLATACSYVAALDRPALIAHEHQLVERACAGLVTVPGLRLVGTAKDRAGVVSFVVDGVHPHDLGTFLDADGVAIRAGHHCAQPLMRRLGITGTARASFAFYNTPAEVDRLVASVRRAVDFFAP